MIKSAAKTRSPPSNKNIQQDDSELLYISFVGILMAAFIANGYHNEWEQTITKFAPEGTTYPFPAGTRMPAVKLTLTVGFFILIAFLYYLVQKLRRNLLRKLFNYRDWLYEPKAFKTKLWSISLKLLLPRKRSLMYFQDVLPKYPLPSFEFTCKKTLKNLEPLVSSERLQEIENEMKLFENDEGKTLYDFLQKRFETEENWVADIWDKYAYLIGRYPLLYTNFCMSGGIFKTNMEPSTKGFPQSSVAANQIYHMAKFYELIKTEKLDCLMMNNLVPICNHRYNLMFATTRLPGPNMDFMKTHDESKHIIVFRKGVMFNLPLYGIESSGNESLLTPEELQTKIDLILKHTDQQSVPNPSVFTTLPRTDWFKEREKLMMRSQNRDSLMQIEKALFHLVLDENSPETLSAETHLSLCGNGFNRWFDKSMTLIIYENGLSGANIEHTSVDATLPSRALEFIFAKMKFNSSGNSISPSDAISHDPISPPTRIEWNLDQLQIESFKIYQSQHLQQASNLDLVALKLNCGKGEIKKLRVSPDSFVQMALQLAFFKLHKSTPKTYETAMTRFFKYGRTETIRTVSKHSVCFTKSMTDPSKSNEERLKALKNAMKYHNNYKLDAMSGRASDRTLFGLMAASKITNLEKQPKLFDLSEIKSGDQLSTSQSPFVFDQKLSKKMKVYPAGGIFSPQTTDGYGVYYIFLGENNMNIHISSYRCHPETSSKMFGDALQASMDEIKQLLRNS